MLIKTSLFLHTDGHFIDVDPGGVGDTGGDVDFGEVEWGDEMTGDLGVETGSVG